MKDLKKTLIIVGAVTAAVGVVGAIVYKLINLPNSELEDEEIFEDEEVDECLDFKEDNMQGLSDFFTEDEEKIFVEDDDEEVESILEEE